MKKVSKVPLEGVEPTLDWFLASCLYLLDYKGKVIVFSACRWVFFTVSGFPDFSVLYLD